MLKYPQSPQIYRILAVVAFFDPSTISEKNGKDGILGRFLPYSGFHILR
jgi:hypothetical protein